jgi:hypothetical protein
MALGLTASNRNEYQEYFLGGKGGRCVGLTLQISYADCHEIWKPQLPGTLWACPGLHKDCFTFASLEAVGVAKPPVTFMKKTLNFCKGWWTLAFSVVGR